ncbi:MAG TPA: hypothetical protein VF533_10770 [Solirubrobacteraceae bacterium]
MVRRTAAAGVVVAVLAGGLNGAGPERAAVAAGRAPALAIAANRDGSLVVVHADPLTLRERPGGARAELGEFHDAWAFSAAGAQIAFGLSAEGHHGGRTAVRVLDRRTLAVRGELEAGAAAQAVGWVADDRIAALTVPHYNELAGRTTTHPGELILGPSGGGPLLARRPLRAPVRCPPAAALTRAGFAAVEYGRRPRLVRVDAAGAYATTSLRGLPRGACAALAADAGGRRLAAVAAGGPLLVVGARRFAVARRITGVRAPARPALVWAGDRRVVVTGTDGPRRSVRAPAGAGARLVDLHTRSVRSLDRTAAGARRAPGGVLTYGRGVRAFTARGVPCWRALGDARIAGLQVAGGRAYADAGRRTYVLDARTGRVVARVRRPTPEPVILLTRAG